MPCAKKFPPRPVYYLWGSFDLARDSAHLRLVCSSSSVWLAVGYCHRACIPPASPASSRIPRVFRPRGSSELAPMVKLHLKGINIQEHWANLIYSGEKTVETRTFEGGIYTDGQPLWLIETPDKPKNGKRKFSEITGVITFGQAIQYSCYEEFRLDYLKHRVPRNSKWDWDPEKITGKSMQKQRMFKWPILDARKLSIPIPLPEKNGTVGCKEHLASVTFEH